MGFQVAAWTSPVPRGPACGLLVWAASMAACIDALGVYLRALVMAAFWAMESRPRRGAAAMSGRRDVRFPLCAALITAANVEGLASVIGGLG